MNNVFIPLSSTKIFNTTNKKYFVSVLVEYIRSLYDCDIPVDTTTQSFCIHFLIKIQEFSYMQMLLQYQSLMDSLDIAQDLVNTGCKGHPKAFQYAIDMYHRLKKPNDVIKILLLNERVKEVLLYVEQYKVKGVPAKEILDVVAKFPTTRRLMYIEYFIKANV